MTTYAGSTDDDSGTRTTRRTLLKGVAAGAIATTMLPGVATAHHGVRHDSSWNGSRVKWGGMGSLAGETIRTFARVTPSGRPVVLGLRIPGAAVRTLNDDPEAEGEAPSHLHLPLPDGLADTPFRFVGMEWNPAGHPGPMYMLPHFDAHFYLVDHEAVEDIPGGAADYDIPAVRMPEGYVRIPDDDGNFEVVPGMGEHLIDPTSPEFNGETFTHTLIWGAYDFDDDGLGELHFVEPMVTGALLADLSGAVTGNVALPESVTAPGYYPTKYGIRYSNRQDAYLVTLFGFQRVN